MTEADTSNTRAPSVNGCAGRLGALYRRINEEADEGEDLGETWSAAERDAIAALAEAPARSAGELPIKAMWAAHLVAEYAGGMGSVLHALVAAVARDARALAAGAR